MATATNNDVEVIDELDNALYHQRPEVSSSMLSDFVESPEIYYGRYIAGTMPRKVTTPSMAFGTLFHDAVLLGLDSQAVEIPESVLSKDGHRKGPAWNDFAAEHAGRSLLKREEYATLHRMVDAVWAHPIASQVLLLTDAAVEQTILWTDEETGLRLKCRPDCRRLSLPLIVDLKTTADVSRRAVATSMHTYGYHRQAAFYRAGVKAYTRLSHDFMFIFVEKDPPHRVRCFELDPAVDRAMTKGYEDFRGALSRLAECHRTGEWHDPGWNEVLTLDLPNWAYSNQWEYVDDGNSTTAE